MFGGLFSFGSKSHVGIDVGTSSTRVVEIKKKGGDFELENYGELKVSTTNGKSYRLYKEDNLLLSTKAVADAIHAVREESEIKTRECSFSIPDFSTFFTTLDLPVMNKEELPEAIRYEVRPYIPLPLSEINVEWLVTEGEISKTPLKLLVVAIPNDTIEQYQEIAKRADLEIKALEPEIFSLVRSTVKEGDGTVALVDLGARSTTCSIIENGTVKVSHSLNRGGNQLTDTLARSLDIDYNKAREIKEKYGIAPGEVQISGQSVDVQNILMPLVDFILGETKKVIRNFYQEEGKKVKKMILAGGVSLMPGLKNYFFSETKTETQIADPFAELNFDPKLKEALKKEGPSYAVAVGVALKGLKK